jgi:hypothetical protein
MEEDYLLSGLRPLMYRVREQIVYRFAPNGSDRAFE